MIQLFLHVFYCLLVFICCFLFFELEDSHGFPTVTHVLEFCLEVATLAVHPTKPLAASARLHRRPSQVGSGLSITH